MAPNGCIICTQGVHVKCDQNAFSAFLMTLFLSFYFAAFLRNLGWIISLYSFFAYFCSIPTFYSDLFVTFLTRFRCSKNFFGHSFLTIFNQNCFFLWCFRLSVKRYQRRNSKNKASQNSNDAKILRNPFNSYIGCALVCGFPTFSILYLLQL